MFRVNLTGVMLALAMLGGAAFAQGPALRIGMRDDPDLLDPTLSRTYVGTLVMTAICDKLFDFDANQAIVPVLATGYEWTDSTNLLIHIRPGVRFQDGEALDAAAVKYTLERHVMMPGSFRRNDLGAMDHVEVVDPLTVRVALKQPFSPFVAVLTDRAGMMISPKAAEAAGKDFGQHPVCAGPFRFVERVAQDHITLERFPGYWDAARIHYDRVTYRVIPDSTIRLTNLQSDALDIAEVAPLDVQVAKATPKLTVVSVPSLGYGALNVNLAGSSPLGRDPRVRHAFELSLDRAALSQVVFAGMYEPNAQAISAASPYYARDIPMPPHDVASAKDLLRQAGITAPVRVSLLVYNTPQGVQAGEVIQAMAAEAGFDVKLVVSEFGAVINATMRGEFELVLGGWSGLLDPDSNSYPFLHSGQALNITKYANPHADELLEGARRESDADRRRALYEQLWRQEQADLPLIYLWTTRNILGVSKKVTGARLLANGLLPLQDIRPAP
jgi:peptide/nickel transport system substrate-binding protein